MTAADLLREALAGVEVNETFTEAVLSLHDGSKLSFCHRVGERWAKASDGSALAGRVLAQLAQFRLNARHLDLRFADGGRWEARFEGRPR
jgi:hypothetical protein